MPRRKTSGHFRGIQAKLIFPREEDKLLVLDLMRRFSAGVRFAYKRLLEGKPREELKREGGPLCTLFRLNTRYADDAVLKAQAVLDSARERGKTPGRWSSAGERSLKGSSGGTSPGRP